MPYEGEFAHYQPLRRIAETDRVRQLLKRAKVQDATPQGAAKAQPIVAPISKQDLPEFIVAIDGSHAEVPVRNGYPGARVGYCTVASVLLDLKRVGELDAVRPIDPREFRRTE